MKTIFYKLILCLALFITLFFLYKPQINNKIYKGKEKDVYVSVEMNQEVHQILLDDYLLGVVAGEMPASFELEAIKGLVGKQLIVACGGGGIPVTKEGNELHGAAAVIDKDWTSSLLAQEIDADVLVILTAVEKVAINFGKENEKWLDEITVTQAKEYVSAGEFAEGSMKPKVEAAIAFAESKKGRVSIITLLEKSKDGIAGKTGTRIVL